MVAGLAAGLDQGLVGCAGNVAGLLAQPGGVGAGHAAEGFAGGKHQADQHPGRRLILQQLGQGNLLKGQQAMGQPQSGFRQPGSSISGQSGLKLTTQPGGQMQRAGQIGPMARVDIAAAATHAPQARSLGQGFIRPNLNAVPRRR